MLLGAIVLCFLVLLVLITDRAGSRLFHGDSHSVFYRCEACGLRYPRREIADPGLRICPAGHPIALEESHTAAGVVGIFACIGFLGVALVLFIIGVGH
ncbi:MAG: hypothetical protein JOZ46_08900 [Candidatus Dormibacteraeota bacterium]|nr:hypothetical protein [Candidatus Dormibacteraeota bacterium]MBV9525915.1 hypothetical protein [Candidatus Dormibacteraeota bacterium]